MSIYWGINIDYQGSSYGSYYGQSIPGSPLEAFEQHVGKRPSLVHVNMHPQGPGGAWLDWNTHYKTAADTIHAHGCLPMFSWGNWNIWDHTYDFDLRLSRIVAGALDRYLASTAQQLAAVGYDVLFRPLWEMNTAIQWGSFAWQASPEGTVINNGGHTWTQYDDEYVAAWRHIKGIFVAQGATNVRFVWCPNVVATSGPTRPLASYWPGSSSVDCIAPDGYNDQYGASFSQLFRGGGGWRDTWADCLALDDTGRIPFGIAEVNCSLKRMTRSSRAAWWTTALLTDIPYHLPRVAWFCPFWWTSRGGEWYALDVDQTNSAAPAFNENNADFVAFRHGIGSDHYLAGGPHVAWPGRREPDEARGRT